MKTQSNEKRALMFARHDVIYLLEPVVDMVMAQGLEGEPLVEAVAASVERVLRVSLTDSGLPVTIKGGVTLRTTTIKKEGARLAKELVKRLTVTDAMLSVYMARSERHGRPYAVAAAEALAAG